MFVGWGVMIGYRRRWLGGGFFGLKEVGWLVEGPWSVSGCSYGSIDFVGISSVARCGMDSSDR